MHYLILIMSSIIYLGSPTCSEVVSYLDAIGSTSTIEYNAVNRLVIDLKQTSVWDQLRGLYLFSGSTASTQKFNLKNSADSDAAYRLSFAADTVGAHTSDGYIPNGTTQYADTHLALGNMTDPSHHALGFFSNAIWSGTGEVIGANKETLIQFHNPTSNNYDLSLSAVFGTLSQGLVGWLVDGPVNVAATVTIRTYNNLALSITTYHVGSVDSSPTVSLYLGARNNDSTADEFKSINLGAVYIGEKIYTGSMYSLHRALTNYLLVMRPSNSPSLLSNVCVFFGDSITAGQVESGETTTRWTTLLCSNKGWNEWNCGMSGTTMQSGTSASTGYGPSFYERITEIPTKTSNEKYLVISYGTNDVLLSALGSNITTQLQAGINLAIARGWSTSNIKVQSTYYLPNNLVDEATVNTAISAACTATGVTFLNTHAYFAANGGAALIQSDHIHPNNDGVTAIATFLGSQLA